MKTCASFYKKVKDTSRVFRNFSKATLQALGLVEPMLQLQSVCSLLALGTMLSAGELALDGQRSHDAGPVLYL